jgi:hypothetical protein
MLVKSKQAEVRQQEKAKAEGISIKLYSVEDVRNVSTLSLK